MKVTVNFEPKESDGYKPRKALTVYNVSGVVEQGPRMVQLRMTFTDLHPTMDHVVSVSIIPDKE